MSRVLLRVPVPVPVPVMASLSAFRDARLGVLGCVLGMALLSAGCASQQAAHRQPSRVVAPSADGQPQQWAARVEIEDDGLPAQLAPRHRRSVPDEPSEPWSPNYGSPPVTKAKSADRGEDRHPALAQPMRRTLTAPAMPVAAHTRTARAIDLDEDAIVRRAITEHTLPRRD